jgi:HPt (histidine-containing phosphotransfer) domain-containing protein
MNHHCQIDPAALERLCRLGGDEFAARMIDLFGSFGAQKIGDARSALEVANRPEVVKAMHSMKSSAGNVGAVEVQDLAARIEHLAAQSQCESLEKLMEELELSFKRTKLELEKARPRSGSTTMSLPTKSEIPNPKSETN